MKRAKWIAAAGVALVLILLVLILEHVSRLREKVQELESRLYETEDHLLGAVDDLYDGIQRELEREASLFSDTETGLDYRDGALVLTASVTPKEVRTDETLTLSANGVSAPMEQGADGVYTGTLSLPLTAEDLSPAVAFISPEGTRQEALGHLRANHLLHVEAVSSYERGEDGTTAVFVGLDPYTGGPVDGRADVASLTLRVADGDTGRTLGTVEMGAVVPPENPPTVIPDEDGVTPSAPPGWNRLLWYSADLSQYLMEEDYDLEFWAELTTAGGLTLTSDGTAATSYSIVFFSPAWEE